MIIVQENNFNISNKGSYRFKYVSLKTMRSVSIETMMTVSISPSFFWAQTVEDSHMIWVDSLLKQLSDGMEF